jgi:hypothetical protein
MAQAFRESFNTGDSDTLGPDLTWTELAGDTDIVSNTARSVTLASEVLVRADHDCDTDDMYVTCVIDATTAGTAADIGVMLRKDASATKTFYVASLDFVGDLLRWYRCIAGTYTELASTAIALTPGTPVVVYAKVTGTSPCALVMDAGGTALTFDDSNAARIQTGTRGGFRGFKTTSGAGVWEGFGIGDVTNINTANKRRSVAHIAKVTVALPVADGTIGTQDRPHTGRLYAGITIAAPAGGGQPTMRRWGHVMHMPTTMPRVAGIR